MLKITEKNLESFKDSYYQRETTGQMTSCIAALQDVHKSLRKEKETLARWSMRQESWEKKEKSRDSLEEREEAARQRKSELRSQIKVRSAVVCFSSLKSYLPLRSMINLFPNYNFH